MTSWDWKHSLSELHYKKGEQHCVKEPKWKARNEKGKKKKKALKDTHFRFLLLGTNNLHFKWYFMCQVLCQLFDFVFAT